MDQRRPPALRVLDDPWARHFLSPAFRAALGTIKASGPLGEWVEAHSTGLAAYILTRHRYIDDLLVAALARGIEQVVILGAGYDTRAYRFSDALAGRPVWELDFPATSARKLEILGRLGKDLPPARVQHLQIDFRQEQVEDALFRGQFLLGRPTFFIWEGVSMYLTRDAVKATLHMLQGLGGPGSELAMDFWFLLDAPDLVAAAHRLTPNLLHVLGEPITFGIHPDDVTHFLDRLGYRANEVMTAARLEARYLDNQRSVYPADYVVHATWGS
ncbi:MAG: SAM-dependent methyltransferase [Deltaproteobacteria bacterium]|nr:SAM-dependent methyltransferase [Deltaproteobacteria bacterium]